MSSSITPIDLEFTNVGRYVRSHFVTTTEILRDAVGKPRAIMQANVRHRSQIWPYMRAFLDSKAAAFIVAVSEDARREYGVCVEDAAYLTARTMDEYGWPSHDSRWASKRVAFNFDHAVTLNAAQGALEAGVSGIMYDPSEGGKRIISIEENIDLSKPFVDLARRYRTGIELEAGTIPGKWGIGEFTDPRMVAILVQVYPEASVAVSVGNEHHRLSPRERGLQLDLFQRIREAVPGISLVMHGGSGVSDEDIETSIARLLLDKLNVGTEFMKTMLLTIASLRGMKEPTQGQLKDISFCRDLLFHLDTHSNLYLHGIRKAVYDSVLEKLVFLTEI